MQPKTRTSPIKPRTMPKRPVMDVVVSKQAAQFPGVGLTMPRTNRYQYDPRDRNRRRPGQPTAVKTSRWQRLKQKITLKRAVITLLLLVMLAGGFVAGKFLWNAHKLFGGNILGVLNSTELKGEDKGRVNILLAGNSADDPGHSGATLTDSIMLLSLDTRNNKAFMLSIPRDLWVQIPGDGHEKINAVYNTGEESEFAAAGYPSGGMGLLQRIISRDFGVPIHYYALVNYSALQQAVDAVGGVDITVKSEDPRGLYDPNLDWKTKKPLVKLSNGKHHIGGRQALNLARARGDSYYSYGYASSDFTRTEHQRQLIVALKSKATSPGVITNPAKLGSLFDAAGNNVKTDFKVDEVRRLYELVKKIDNRNIKSLSLNDAEGKNLLESYNAFGQSALIPARGIDNFSEIQSYIRRQTSSNPIVQEAAKVVVLNGTDINGLAVRWKNRLNAKNFTVYDIGDAISSDTTTTTIIDASAGKKPSTRSALVKTFGQTVTSQNPYANVYEADFIIVLGTDRASNSR